LEKYILLSSVTEKGITTIKDRPNRIKEVNKEVEQYGVKVLEQYAVLGPYDFVTIVEAPDNNSIYKMSIELGSRGSVKITSMPATLIDNFIANIEG
jgi:uncharacterized protein with GYD domain